MRIDRTHVPWIAISTLILGAAIAVYIPYHVNSLNGPSGNSWIGLTYGIIGSAFILFCGAIGMRRKIRTWRIGKAQSWLRAHIWLGLISFPLILLHAGFDFGPTGGLTWVMMWLFVGIIVTGIFGVLMQHYLPPLLMGRVTKETIYEQIDTVVERLRWEGDFMVSGVCGKLPDETLAEQPEGFAERGKPGKPPKNPAKYPAYMLEMGHRTGRALKDAQEGSRPLREFYLNEVQPYLLSERPHPLEGGAKSGAIFQRVRNLVPPNLHETLRDLEELVEERRQLDLQGRVHRWLHLWLLVHGPISYAMILLSIVHAVMALYY